MTLANRFKALAKNKTQPSHERCSTKLTNATHTARFSQKGGSLPVFVFSGRFHLNQKLKKPKNKKRPFASGGEQRPPRRAGGRHVSASRARRARRRSAAAGPLPRRGRRPGPPPPVPTGPRGRGAGPARGRPGLGAPLRQAPEEAGGRGGRTPPPLDFSQARNPPPNAHSPDKNEASAFAGTSRAPLRRAPRAPGKAGMGSGRGRARAAALRAGAQRRGPGWALRCPGR